MKKWIKENWKNFIDSFYKQDDTSEDTSEIIPVCILLFLTDGLNCNGTPYKWITKNSYDKFNLIGKIFIWLPLLIVIAPVSLLAFFSMSLLVSIVWTIICIIICIITAIIELFKLLFIKNNKLMN